MLLSVDPSAPLPVYEQIRAQVASMIATGTLAPGTRLPTIRQLCDDLGVAKATVSRSYELLVRDGLIVANGRHGTVVAHRRAPRLSRPVLDRRLHEAATLYAVTAHQLGVDEEHAVTALRTVLRSFPPDA
jgi:DNA-binding transcriptional regulator YhcF (GntR family)